MRILVTGGAGYAGSVLVPELIYRGHEVRVLDNLVYGQAPLLPFFITKKFDFVKGDIRDFETVKRAVAGMDAIVHLAAIVGDPACRKDEKLAEEVNYQGTVNLIKARNKDQKLIYASTGSVYGALEGICTETSPVNPLTTYAKTKLAAENEVMNSGNTVAYRFATAFGLSARLRLDLLPNDFVFQAVRNGSLMVFERHFRRTFIHVRDMVDSYCFGIDNFKKIKDEFYNVGSKKMNYTKEEMATKIKEQVDYVLLFVDKGGSDPDKRDYEVSYEKIRQKGFETKISLEEGITELIKGYQMLSLRNPYSNVEER